jgi:hypothetical protein
MPPIMTDENVVKRIVAEAPLSTSAAPSAFD